jgi:plasmid segregation protein ParM
MSYVIGLDHGNGWVKAKTASNELTLPSYYAKLETVNEGYGNNKIEVKEYESNISKGEKFVWGREINRVDHVIPTYGAQDRYKQMPYKLLTEFALADVAAKEGDAISDVTVVTGVPSIEKGTDAEKDLINVVRGDHLVIINDKGIILRVSDVKVLPQPVGVVMSEYLDADGFVEDESFETDSVAVIDIGTGTTDIDHVKSLKRQKGDSDSILLGMNDVYRRVADWINSKNTSARATVGKVESQFANDSYVISKRSVIEIDEIKEKALDEVAAELKTEIIGRWKTWERFDRILLTGGGATQLGKRLQSLIPDAEIVKDPQTANVEGFYRYGKSLVGDDE